MYLVANTKMKKSERGGGEEGDRRSHLIHPDYKVRLRLSDTVLPPFSFSPSLSPSLLI